MDLRVIVIDPAQRFPRALSDSFRDRSSRIRADLNPQPSLALDALAGTSYDAVVTSADTEEDLGVVSRVRRAHPGLPILVVVADPKGPLAAQAVEAGADSVLRRKPGYQEMLDSLELAVQLAAAARKNRRIAHQTRALADEVVQLADELRSRTHEALARAGRAATCVPILVDPDAAAGRAFRAAFAELDPSIPFRVFPSAARAREHLEGHPPGHPLHPTVLLLDLRAPGEPLALLAWLSARRGGPRPRVLVFAADAVDRAQALALGADDCSPKPATPEGLLRLAGRLRQPDSI